MAAMLNGATCLDYVARLVGAADVGALLDRTEAAFRGPSRVLFLPYLAGERTPHNDPLARGVFYGLDPAVETTDIVQAALEGVAFTLLEARGLLERAGVGLESIAAVGGGARSRFWMQLVAHVVGLPVTRYAAGENGPAFGAARLARLALTGERTAEVCSRRPVRDVLAPDPALTAAYAERFAAFTRLYASLKGEFRRGTQA
jgi:xylulokinase